MTLAVKEITNKKELKRFIKFPFKLYKENPNYVPPLMEFEMSSLDKQKNPAFKHSKARYWVVENDGEIVGRIAGIIVDQELAEKQLARFGWIDFIDDTEVSDLLLKTVSDWAKSQGASAIHGPMGFTDMDFEGAQTQGFDLLATQVALYNYAYYIDHFERQGLAKTATWVELRDDAPKSVPERVTRAIPLLKKRYEVEVKSFKSSKQLKKYIPEMFEIVNEAYADLYGYHQLTEEQINYYIELYFDFVKKEFLTLVVDKDDRLVGFAVSLPSLSKALQKAKGYLFPFGFIHVLRSFFFGDTVDMLLIGVRPEWQKSGINALIISEQITQFNKAGIKYITSGPMLENNVNVLQFFKGFGFNIGSIKRSVFQKTI